MCVLGCSGPSENDDAGSLRLDGSAEDAGKDGGDDSGVDAGSADVDAGFRWTSCVAYLDGGGSPDDPCAPSFGMCSDGEGCCNTYTCEDGHVVETPPLCDGPCILRGTCAGYVPPPPDRMRCRTDADCGDPDMGCLPPGEPEPPCCGICFEPPRECGDGLDCSIGNVCESTPVTCSCSGPATSCVPDCRLGSCAGTDVCDVGTGLCRPPRCDEGAECPPSATCTGGECVRRTCTADSDCDCGACVDGRCYEGEGSCIVTAPLCA